MKRRSNWPKLLAEFLEAKRTQPFDWATNNCAFFACDWIALATGVDPAAKYRGKVATPAAAIRIIVRAGGLEKVVEKACARWGWGEIRPMLAQRGDVVVCDLVAGATIGICLGAKALFADNNTASMATCVRAWRIG